MIKNEADSRTYKDEDEAEYYRNKELYANSGLARHKEAMEKAKKACKGKGIELEECKSNKIEEAEVTNLKEVKNQGNIYMLEDDTHKIIVGENYNADEGLIENAEIYESKEEADKDYLDRCNITGGTTKEVVEEGIVDNIKKNHYINKAVRKYNKGNTDEGNKALDKAYDVHKQIDEKNHKNAEKLKEKSRKIYDKAREVERKSANQYKKDMKKINHKLNKNGIKQYIDN